MPRKEQVAAALRYLGDKADLKRRYERMVSLDQPQDADAIDMALEMGGSIVPGVGQVLAARDFERARRADDEAGMAMAAASAVPVGRLIGALKGFDPAMREIKAYHGTADDFDVFDPAMGGRATNAESGRQATWFTDDPRVAKGYAVYAAEMGPYNRKVAEADKVKAQLDAITDPKLKREASDEYYRLVREAGELEENAYARREANARLLEVDIPDNTNMLVIDAKGKTPFELSMNKDTDSWLKTQLDRAKRSGKQGIQIKNLDDAAGLADAPATHYAVFDPSGVKVLSKKKLIEKK
jgi:hypothetical protein